MFAAAESPEMEAFRKEIEGQLATMKGLYEGRIKELESRIGTLESDNARLKQQASPKTKAADSAELANMRQRVEDLESLAGQAAPQMRAASQRAQTNAQAIEAIELKLQASATETRDI